MFRRKNRKGKNRTKRAIYYKSRGMRKTQYIRENKS